MIYELLDTDEHPLVVVAAIEPAPNPGTCECGSPHQALAVHLHGSAPTPVKAVGLLSAVASLLSDSDTSEEDGRMIRRGLAKLLEMSS